MDNEYRIYGPPGTGKTTYLARQISRAVDKYGEDRVMVTSFTVAAAREIAGRGLDVERSMVGTLHAHCYRALGRPLIAEEKLLAEWNSAHPETPIGQSASSPLDEGMEDTAAQASAGDATLAEVNRLRGRMVPVEDWMPPQQEFYRAWCEFKRDHSAMDYTDLLENGLAEFRVAPGSPDVIFVDEAQDLSRLQIAVIRSWGRTCERLVLVGDDDQTLYRFTGATPDTLLDPPLPESQIITLKQSYRVPRAVHACAVEWIQQVTRRAPKEYEPRAEDGAVRMSKATYTAPGAICDEAAAYAESGKTVMILAACAYQLAGALRRLREIGIPYWNPYRLKRGDWNPLAARQGTSAAQRVLALLLPHECMGDDGREWTFADLCAWLDWQRSDPVWRRGAKKEAEARPPDDIVTDQWLDNWMQPGARNELWDAMEDRDPGVMLDWWRRNLSPAKAPSAEYVTQIARRLGPGVLRDHPRVVVGTIHSVKGAQADVVYLFPDLSASGVREWRTQGEARDSVIRQFYVGMTRAREELVICSPAGANSSVSLWQ